MLMYRFPPRGLSPLLLVIAALPRAATFTHARLSAPVTAALRHPAGPCFAECTCADPPDPAVSCSQRTPGLAPADNPVFPDWPTSSPWALRRAFPNGGGCFEAWKRKATCSLPSAFCGEEASGRMCGQQARWGPSWREQIRLGEQGRKQW